MFKAIITFGLLLVLFFPPAGSIADEAVPKDTPETHDASRTPESSPRKSYLIPALEVPGLVILLNGVGRALPEDEKSYNTDLSTFWNNITDEDWTVDKDRFVVNQLGHPYMGVTFQGFARSAGLNFWESFIYTFAGSFLWGTAREASPPSINDQVMSGVAGNFFGEPLYRMSNLLLEGGGGKPGVWRELGAAVLSPSNGFNRFIFGERFRRVFPSNDPAYFWRLRIGESINSHPGVVTRSIPQADFAMYYGLPGKEGYTYKRPFDYFEFRLAALAHAKNAIENVTASGLLFGDEYSAGGKYRGIWGIYGSYDYLSPHIFKASTTALSLGTTVQWRLYSEAALQGSVLGGAGYGAAGIDEEDETETRTYRYGTTVQAAAELRLNLKDIAQIEAGAREYYVSRLGGTKPKGSELIGRYNAGLTVRVYGKHALGFQYVSNLRDAEASGLPDRHQSVETFSILYTYLSDPLFGMIPSAPESQ